MRTSKRQKVDIPDIPKVDQKKDIPKEIIFQILKELPAKYLLRFRCVSKLWCSIIDDPLFINSHRSRSHTRPGGTTILVLSRLTLGPDAYHFFSLNPEGGSPVSLQTFATKNCHPSLSSVDGLVCLGNVVWNPTTRESIKLPPLNMHRDLNVGLDIDSDYDSTSLVFVTDFFLGFAPSSMEYKVLNKSHISITKNVPDTHIDDSTWEGETQVMCKILTIGSNLWRTVGSLTREFWGFFHERSLCINGMIYWFCSYKDKMLTFDVGLEQFRWVSLPSGEDRLMRSIQVGERLALIDKKVKKIWILDDTGRWNMERLIIPKRYANSSPVGTIHSNEILLRLESHNHLKLFYYDQYNKTLRRIRFAGLPETDDVYNISFAKQVECLFRLKVRN